MGYHCCQLHNILWIMLLSRLSPYLYEITGGYRRVFRRNRSTTDKIFCICQILRGNGSTMRQYISYP
jgi:hypothetical protein